MNYINMQDEVRNAIRANATFSATATSTIHSDLGTEKALLEKSLQDYGFAIAVWPPTKGTANRDEDAHQGVEAVIVVRLEINPTQLSTVDAAWKLDNTKPTRAQYINNFVAKVISSVLGITPEPTGVRFQLAADAFEMISFDEGLLAYHIRFTRFTVFGA